MRVSRNMFVALVASCVLLASCAAEQATHPTELEGVWAGSNPASGPGPVRVAFTFRGRWFTLSGVDNDVSQQLYSGSFHLDTSADPRKLDLYIDRSRAYPEYIGSYSYCIYDVNGNTLTIAASDPGVVSRPTAFVRSIDSRVYSLQRVE